MADKKKPPKCFPVFDDVVIFHLQRSPKRNHLEQDPVAAPGRFGILAWLEVLFMNKQEVKGGAQKVGGKVEEQFGKMTGNPVTQEKGREKQAEGAIRQTAGKVKDAIEHPSKR